MQHFHKFLGSSSEVLMLPTLYVHLKFNFKIIFYYLALLYILSYIFVFYMSVISLFVSYLIFRTIIPFKLLNHVCLNTAANKWKMIVVLQIW